MPGPEEIRILHQGGQKGVREPDPAMEKVGGPAMTYEDQGQVLRQKFRELMGELTQVAEATLKHSRDVTQLTDRQVQQLQHRDGQLAGIGRELQRVMEQNTEFADWLRELLRWVPDDFDNSIPENVKGHALNRFGEWLDALMAEVMTMLTMHFDEDRPSPADEQGLIEWEKRKAASWGAIRSLVMGEPTDHAESDIAASTEVQEGELVNPDADPPFAPGQDAPGWEGYWVKVNDSDCPLRHVYGEEGWRPSADDGVHEHWIEPDKPEVMSDDLSFD